MSRRFVSVGCMALLGLLPAVSLARAAQQAPLAATQPATREEALKQQREGKQRETTPNEPDGLQRLLDGVENNALNITAREGFFPKLGSLTTGSGFAMGVGFRDRDLFFPHGRTEVWAAGSFKRYWAVQGRTIFPELASGRLMAEVVADLREYPKESFFGLGPDSRRSDMTEFALRQREVTGRVGVRVAPALTIGGNAGWYAPDALGERIDYRRAGVFAEVDYRQPLNARRGGWYRLDVSRHADGDGGRHSFTRTDLDIRQFIGFLGDRRVIAVRGYVSTLDADDDAVPFYLMPTLGGHDTLRGFRNYRFRGPHALLLQAEYRWEVWSGLDAALFYDAGKVSMRRGDLNLKRLEDDYGFGFRFNTVQGVVVRVDAAFGSRDGKHLQIVFGGVF